MPKEVVLLNASTFAMPKEEFPIVETHSPKLTCEEALYLLDHMTQGGHFAAVADSSTMELFESTELDHGFPASILENPNKRTHKKKHFKKRVTV